MTSDHDSIVDKPALELDSTTLKALSHPLRVRLWDRLVMIGPATATLLAQETGESTGSTSYHLRQLAKHGLVEEAADRSHGRQRWWRAVPRSVRVDSRQLGATPAGRELVESFSAQWATLRSDTLARFHARVAQGAEPQAWVDASTDTTSPLYLTVAELKALSDELTEVVLKYARIASPAGERPSPQHRRVEVAVRVFPSEEPGDGDEP